MITYNRAVASPWHSWIARLPPEQKAVGSNPAGDATLIVSLAAAGLLYFSRSEMESRWGRHFACKWGMALR